MDLRKLSTQELANILHAIRFPNSKGFGDFTDMRIAEFILINLPNDEGKKG